MKKLLFLLLFVSLSAFAGGDKVKNPWQPVEIGTCSVFLPAGIDQEKCEVVETTQSGIAYLCSGIEAYCPSSTPVESDDDKDDD